MAADPTTPAPDTAPEPVLETVPDPTTDLEAAPPADTTAALPYVTKLWNDLPLYVCPACGYDTLLNARITAHQLTCQALVRPGQQPREPGVSVAETATADAAPDTAVVPPPGEEA